MSDFSDVGRFHRKFGLHSVTDQGAGPTGAENNYELMDFRMKFMNEELGEFQEALANNDHAKAFDSLLDLAYVVFGTAHLLGYPWEEGWLEVQRANMKKVRAERAEDSKRGSTYDVVKPEGWEPPDIAQILKYYGFVV